MYNIHVRRCFLKCLELLLEKNLKKENQFAVILAIKSIEANKISRGKLIVNIFL